MLTHLSVKNLAVVESAAIEFGAGLNIITGETGAGKSVLMGALDLVLGGRADKSAIRDGATEARVEAIFKLANPTAVNAMLATCELDPCDVGELIVRRSVTTAGTGKCFINDVAVTVQTLRRIGCLIVDIHGPYDHQSLLDSDFQRTVLDAYGACSRVAYEEAWHALQETRQRYDALRGTVDVADEIDRLTYRVKEIEDANLTEDDGDALITRHAEAAHAEQILSLGRDVMQALTDDETSAFDMLARVQQHLSEMARIIPDAAEWHDEAASAATQIQDLSRSIADRLSAMDADPEQLQALDERLGLIQKLKRKYGATIAEILATRAHDQQRLDDLSSRTEQLATLELTLATQRATVLARGKELTTRRCKAAAKLGKAITSELRDLGFLKADFAVAIEPAEPSESGCDEIIFNFAPNPGESMRALKAIASSGEIARVMLAVKAVLAEHDSIPVLIFDEIDANIGGEVGRAVGQKMRHVASKHQVIAITHLPQSAVYGRQHFVVTKNVVAGRTRTNIALLTDAQRVDEIARMLGGVHVTSVAGVHARELLEAARE